MQASQLKFHRGDVHERGIHRSRSRQFFTRWSALWDDIQVCTYTHGIIVLLYDAKTYDGNPRRRDVHSDVKVVEAQCKYHAALGHLRYVVVNCTIYYTQQLPISAMLNAAHVMHDFYSICYVEMPLGQYYFNKLSAYFLKKNNRESKWEVN